MTRLLRQMGSYLFTPKTPKTPKAIGARFFDKDGTLIREFRSLDEFTDFVKRNKDN